MAEKDFAPIESDYTFFMTHSTEAESDVAAYQRELNDFLLDRTSIRLLDFGCGNGDFSLPLLNALNIAPETLHITLCEPVTHQLAQAAERTSRFSHHPVETLGDISDAQDRQFDLIVANHVLYYVHDLRETIREMRRALAPGGKLALTMASWENMLLEVWKVGFGLIDREVPYYTSEDVQRVLAEERFRVQKSESRYQLRFTDTEENRRKVLRFCFGEHLPQIPLPQLVELFDKYQQGENVLVDTWSDHLLAELPS